MKNASLSRWALLALLPLGAAISTAGAANPPVEQEEARTESVQPGSDAWITTKVKADLLTTQKVPGMEIKVDTVNGVVTLSGMVDTQSEKDRAVQLTRGIEGVRQVDADNLKVAGAASKK